MKLFKRISYLLLALLSAFIFTFAVTACEDETDSSTEASSSSESSSSYNIPEEDKIFYTASYYDVTFNPTLAEDKKSILIEVTPLYHIHNLKIETKFSGFKIGDSLMTELYEDPHINTFEKAQAGKTISFRVYLSDELVNKGELIEIYQYNVIGGEYDSPQFMFNTHLSSIQNDLNYQYTYFDFSIEFVNLENAILLTILPKQPIYDLIVSVYFKFDIAGFISSQPQTQQFSYLHTGSPWLCKFYLPDMFLDQDITITSTSISFEGAYRSLPDTNETISDEYWTQFE